jgi:hypothetical protein
LVEKATRLSEVGWLWPFRPADLMAGLRRHLNDASLQVTEVESTAMTHRSPAIGRLRAMRIEYAGRAGSASCRLVVKEPHGTTRTGLAGAGRREVGVYRTLAPQLPLPTPSLIAASASGDWLILGEVEHARDADQWLESDYRQAIEALVRLHDRFWGLGEDLDAFPWLSRPLTVDFEVHVTAASQALERIRHLGHPAPIAGSPERMHVLRRLTDNARRVADPLREEPETLLHGDYWPGNIGVSQDGGQIVYDWQLAAVGPGVLDLLVFALKSAWWFDALPLTEEAMVALYRGHVEQRLGVRWDDDRWQELWDHALMWRFLQEWVDLLAASPNTLLEARAEQLDRVWLDPVAQAVARRLEVG